MSDVQLLQDLAATMRRIEAKIAIFELLGRYGRALDEWNEAELRKIIAYDVVARHDAVAPPFQGLDTLVGIMKALRPKVQAVQHYITNMHVELHRDGDHATARAFVLAMHDTGVGRGGALLPAGGAYRMEVARVDSEYGWQIGEIEVTETWFDPRIVTDLYEQSTMREGHQ